MCTAFSPTAQLYRGLVPPLIGSTIFRSIQFTVYGATYGALRDSTFATSTIPLTDGLQYRVIMAGVAASTARALCETPLEFVKVRRQTGQRWMVAETSAEALRHPLRELTHAYKGFVITWMRTLGLMTSFFIMVDHLERHHRDWITIPVFGPFIKGGVCATLGWVVVWPFETVRVHGHPSLCYITLLR